MVGGIKDSADQLFFPLSCGSSCFPKEALSDSEETSFLSQSMSFFLVLSLMPALLWNWEY